MSEQIPPDDLNKALLKKKLSFIRFKTQQFCSHNESTYKKSMELSNEIYHCLIDLNREICELGSEIQSNNKDLLEESFHWS